MSAVKEVERVEPKAISAKAIASESSVASRTFGSRVSDYVETTKPRILIMILLTVGVAMVAVEDATTTLWIFVNTMLGTSMVAASASAFNQILERRRDALMIRTAKRPLAAGRLQAPEAIIWGALLLVLGTSLLA